MATHEHSVTSKISKRFGIAVVLLAISGGVWAIADNADSGYIPNSAPPIHRVVKPATPLIDAATEKQIEKAIHESLRLNVLKDIKHDYDGKGSTYVVAFVRPAFYGLEYDSKSELATILCIYYMNSDRLSADDVGLVEFRDSFTNKTVGTFSNSFGLQMKD